MSSGATRVLVTGGGGFIGRPAVERLLAAGHEVHVAHAHPPAGGDRRVVRHHADLLDPDAAQSVVAAARPTHLLHLAWYALPGRFWSAPQNIDWVGATLRLLRAFAQAGGRRAVVAGTCAEYAWGEDVLREAETALAPATLYGACKHATHVAAAALAEEVGLSLAWGRIFFLYGPGEDSQRLVASVARALLAGERVAATEGSQLRDFLHVDDVAGAFAALLDSDVSGAVNIGSGRASSVREVIDAIAAATGTPGRVDFGALEPRAGDPPRIVAAVERLRDEVGFVPALELPEGIRRTVAWWRAHPDGSHG